MHIMAALVLINRVLQNKHQAVSQGRYKLEASGLRLEA